MAAALEGEIEQLSHPVVRSWSEVWAHSRSRDWHRCRSRGKKRRCCQVQPEDCHAPYFEYHPSQRSLESRGKVAATKDPNLEELLELGLKVTCFLRGSAGSSEENVRAPSPKPPVEKLQKWVTWKAQAYKTPSWWQELMMVPGVDNHKKLAWEVQASFGLPKRVSKLCQVENYHQAPPALPCLLWKNFLLPPDSIFTCWDIWEIQHEKMVTYAQALQFWAEKVDLSTRGKPHLLAGSVKELWEEMRCYLSFYDEDVFKGMALPEETSVPQAEEAAPQSVRSTPAGTPEEEATMGMAMEPAMEKRPPNKFPGWEKVLHTSRPMVAAMQIPPPLKGPRLRPCSWSLGKGWFESLIPRNWVWWPPNRSPPHLLKSWGSSGKWCHLLVSWEWWCVCRGTGCQKGSAKYPQTQ